MGKVQLSGKGEQGQHRGVLGSPMYQERGACAQETPNLQQTEWEALGSPKLGAPVIAKG